MLGIRGAVALAVVAAGLGAAGTPRAAAATTTTLTTTAAADTYVSDQSRTKSYGGTAYMTVDASPQKRAFVRFNVAGIDGRKVTNVRLRMHQTDTSSNGGRVFGMSNTTWSESMTWGTQPAIDGPQLAEFGRVASGVWYEVSLGPVVAADGAVSFALTTAVDDGSKWTTRESGTAPQLLVDVEASAPPPPPTSDDGLTTVAPSTVGSDEPTFFGMQHRVVRTAAGRTLVVHGRHGDGVQLAWRDPGGAWSNATQGAVTDGRVLRGTGTGDWPASIAIGRGADGAEHAWVVWSGTVGAGETPRPVEIRHLSALDAAAGPVVGAVTRVADPSAVGNGRADIAFEQLPSGATRGWVYWTRRLNSGDYSCEHYVASFDRIESDAPVVNAPTMLLSFNNRSLGSFVTSAAGLRLVMRSASSAVVVYRHDPAVASGGWTSSSAGMSISTTTRPTAAALPNGDTVVVGETDTTNAVVKVQRFSSTGTPAPVELNISGYRQPTIAAMADGTAVVVAIRAADGALVSRTLTAGTSTWSGSDRVELGPEGGGNYQWPNAARQSNNTLRLIVRGPAGGSYQSSVLSVVRTL